MKHKHPEDGRRCNECGKIYYRSNRIRMWTATNPGHRMGWQKIEVKLCTVCFTAKHAQRVMTMASIEVQPVRLRVVR